MSVADFGFDPTFLWFKDENTHLQSYQIPLDIVRSGFQTMPWIFEMPERGEEGGLENEGQKREDIEDKSESEGVNKGVGYGRLAHNGYWCFGSA